MLPLLSSLVMGWEPQISANGSFYLQHGLMSSQSLLVLGFRYKGRRRREGDGRADTEAEKYPWKSSNGLGWEGPERAVKNKGCEGISVPSDRNFCPLRRRQKRLQLGSRDGGQDVGQGTTARAVSNGGSPRKGQGLGSGGAASSGAGAGPGAASEPPAQTGGDAAPQ